jgi:predicted MFS family arabinose efflux permease
MPDAPERPKAVMSVLVPGAAMIAVTFGLARYGYGLLLPDMRAETGMTAATAGVISSAAYASYLVVNIGVVQLASRWGPRLAVGGAAALAALGMLAIAVADGVVLLAVGVLVAGAAAGMAFPPYADIVDREVAPARRDMVWSTISSGTGWGVALAGPIAIVAGDHWRAAWAVFVVLAVGVGVLATVKAPAHDGDQMRRPQLSMSWFFCPRSRPLLVSAVLVGGGSSTWWAFSVDAMRNTGLDATSARIVYAACGAAMLLASFSGVVFERRGLRSSYLGSTVLLAASLALLAVATANLAAVLVAAVLFGAFYATVIAAHGIWSARVFSTHPAAGLAAVSTALTIGTLAGPVLAGIAIQYAGYAPALTGAAVVALAALPFCPPTAERRKVLAAHEQECTAAPVRP